MKLGAIFDAFDAFIIVFKVYVKLLIIPTQCLTYRSKNIGGNFFNVI